MQEQTAQAAAVLSFAPDGLRAGLKNLHRAISGVST
jgi:hypothetical protein